MRLESERKCCLKVYWLLWNEWVLVVSIRKIQRQDWLDWFPLKFLDSWLMLARERWSCPVSKWWYSQEKEVNWPANLAAAGSSQSNFCTMNRLSITLCIVSRCISTLSSKFQLQKMRFEWCYLDMKVVVNPSLLLCFEPSPFSSERSSKPSSSSLSPSSLTWIFYPSRSISSRRTIDKSQRCLQLEFLLLFVLPFQEESDQV